MIGPSEEELFEREGDETCSERWRRRKDDGQPWEERLQENWENCLVNQWTSMEMCLEHQVRNTEILMILVPIFFFSGVKSVLPGLR